MSIKLLAIYLETCKSFNLKPSFEGLNNFKQNFIHMNSKNKHYLKNKKSC